MYRQIFQNSHEEIHFFNIQEDPNTQCNMIQIPQKKVSKLTAAQKYKIQKHKQKMRERAEKRQSTKNKLNKNRFLKCYSDRFVRFLLTGIFISMFLYILFLMFHKKSGEFNIYLKIKGDQQINNVLISKLGLDENPQVGSYLDYFNITKNRRYMKFKQNYLQYFTYKTYGIEQKYLKMQKKQQSNQNKKEKIQQKQGKIKSQQVQHYIFFKYMDLYHQKLKNQPNNIQATFKNLQGLNSQQKDKIQQYYVNLAYNTSHQTTQTPLCIISYNFHTFNQNIYQSFFTSIFKQKFNNFKLILIDDKSSDDSSQKIIKLLQDRFNKYQHLVTIVKNDQYLGKLGSYFINAQNCKQNQVTMYLDVGYTVVGRLSFAIVSNAFKDQNIWLAYTDIIQEIADDLKKQDKKLKIPISQIRTSSERWQFPEVFAVRKKLLTKITIQQLIQYFRIEKQKNIYLPQFYDSKQNKFLIIPLLQLCEETHLLFLQYLLFIHNNRQHHPQNNTNCIIEKQKVNDYKVKLKYSLKKLQNLSQNQQLQPISEPSLTLIKQLKQQYQEYSQCMKNVNTQIKPTLRIKKQMQKQDNKL